MVQYPKEKRDRLIVLIVFFIAFTLYSLTRARNLSLAHDSIAYLNELTSSQPVWYAHHLFWHVLVQWVGSVSKYIFTLEDAVIAINIMAGAGVVSTVYIFCRNRLSIDIFTSLLLAAGVGLSYGIWTYSTVVEVYMLPIMGILLSLYLLTRCPLSPFFLALSGFCHVLAVLFHQSHILFYPVVGYVLWINRKQLPWKAYSMYYILSTCFLLIGTYIYVMVVWADVNAVAGGWRWVVGYGNDSQYWVGWNVGILIKPWIGLIRTFIGGQFILAMPGIDWILQKEENYDLVNDRILVSDISVPVLIVIGSMLCILVGIGILLTYRAIHNGVCRRVTFNHIIRTLIVMWLSYAIFFCFWVPENLEFWLLQNIGIWLLAGYGWYKYGGINRRELMLGLVLLLGFINYSGAIHWQRQRAYDYYYQLISSWEKIIPCSQTLLLLDPWIIRGYVQHYTELNYITIENLPDMPCYENQLWIYPYTEKIADPKGMYEWTCKQYLDNSRLGICNCSIP